MREETLINAVNDIDDIRYKLEDIHQNIMEQPDYWEKLKHKYAGMAMQGILSNTNLMNILGTQKGRELDEMVADLSLKHAKALVEKLKNEK